MYFLIIFTIIIIALSFFQNVKSEYVSCGVFLPNTLETFLPVKNNTVSFYMSDIFNNVVSDKRQDASFGLIHVSSHYVNGIEIPFVCARNIIKAKLLATQFGSSALSGGCTLSGHITTLLNVKLYAFTYR